MKFIQRLQNSFLTSWYWQYWQHEDTGRITMLPCWKKAGRRWYKFKK
jgi:hypothetical protein